MPFAMWFVVFLSKGEEDISPSHDSEFSHITYFGQKNEKEKWQYDSSELSSQEALCVSTCFHELPPSPWAYHAQASS